MVSLFLVHCLAEKILRERKERARSKIRLSFSFKIFLLIFAFNQFDYGNVYMLMFIEFGFIELLGFVGV